MKLNIKIMEDMFSEENDSIIIDFPFDQVSTRELITAKTTQELKNLKLEKNSYAAHIKNAVESFNSNKIIILKNDEQLTELDTEIIITPNTEIIFIKLTPLVGG
jgi:hypothetical protein